MAACWLPPLLSTKGAGWHLHYCCGMWAGRDKKSSQTTLIGCQQCWGCWEAEQWHSSTWVASQKCRKRHLNAENMRFCELSINSFIMLLSQCLNLWEVSKFLFSFEWINGWYKTWPVCFHDFFQFPEKKVLYCYLLSLYDLSCAFHGSGSFQIFNKGPAFVLDTHA